MSSTFTGISTALSGLMAHRKAMDIAGNNIANANTAGYTRQRTDLQSIPGQSVPSLFSTGGLSGNGVRVAGVTRMGDEFLNGKVRSQVSTHADLAGRAATLVDIERVVNEPSTTGLSSQLGKMWSAWSKLVTTPGSDAARVAVINTSQGVVDTLASSAESVKTLWTQTRGEAEAQVMEVNSVAEDVADLNRKIKSIVASGGHANELMDQRDQAVVRLAELTGAVAEPADEHGVVDVHLRGGALVQGGRSQALVLSGTPAGLADTSLRSPSGSDVVLSWKSTATPVGALLGGSLSATVEALNKTIPTEANSYDEIALSLATAVNAQHRAGLLQDGTPGGDFFTAIAGTALTAGNLKLAVTSLAGIAAGAAGKGPADGSNADAMTRIAADVAGPDKLWAKHVVDIGSKVQTASLRATVTQATMAASVADQQAAGGVSLDEETANLLVIQRAYEGAARVLTAVDQALDTLINRTGLVGR